MARITVVNDNAEFLELIGEVLESEQHDATTIDGSRADPDILDDVRASAPDVLIVDLRLGTETLRGWQLIERLRGEREFKSLPILVSSADLPALREAEAILERNRPIQVLAKPFGIDELTDSLDRLLADSIRP